MRCADTHRHRSPPERTSGRAIGSLLIGLTIVLGACGGGGGGGGSGTDVQLRGTVPDNRRLATRELEIRASSGERSRATIGADGRFEAGGLDGTGPFLLRASFGDGEAWYALAELAGSGIATANVHAYTDLALRNVIASNGATIDALFDADGAVPVEMRPDPARVEAVSQAIGGILAPSLDAYGLAGIELARVAFEADGQGVDEFLEKHPALVENEAFTIVATDPVTDTRTTISDRVSLLVNLVAGDTTPPGVPGALRPLPAASDEIVLVWETPKDDVAVTRYEVRRDGQVIATTPYPVYADQPLVGGTDYAYTVVAIDAAGNRSAATPASVASPLDAPDTTPPPTPTDVEVTATNSSARVRWTQGDIADVAAFRVLRSVDEGMFANLARSTSTALTELDLSAATEYCYQIVAIDASENPSSPSESACATTSGTGQLTMPLAPVTEVPEEPTAPVTPPPASGAAAALLALDVSGLACDAELESSSIDTALTLDAPCYRLPSGLSVREGGRVTVAAGTVLKFGSSATLNVAQGGSLSARGTPSAPIVFSGLDATPGFWGGIRFVFSNSTSNVFENVLIENAGGPSDAALSSETRTSLPTRLALRTVALRGSAGDGFALEGNTLLDAFDEVLSTDNARSGEVTAEVAAAFGPGVRLSGNTDDGLIVSNGTIDDPTSWPAIDVPWLVPTLRVSAPFEVPAGARLSFVAGATLNVSTDGSLRAIGTSDAPITFTGRDATPGFWNGIEYTFSNSVNNRLVHAVVEYGGQAENGGGIVSDARDSLPVTIALEDVTLRFNRGAGFRLDPNTRLDAFERVTSTGNDLPGVVSPEVLPSLGDTLLLEGNTVDVIGLFNATIESATTWPRLPVPYRFDRLSLNATLTLVPGTSLVAVGGAAIVISSDGALNAVGTAAAPITIVGSNPFPGHWEGISYSFTNSPQNRLEHVTVRHGGSGTSTTRGNLTLDCNGGFPARVALANTTIADSAGWGVYRDPIGCTVDVGAGTVFTNNVQGDINPITP